MGPTTPNKRKASPVKRKIFQNSPKKSPAWKNPRDVLKGFNAKRRAAANQRQWQQDPLVGGETSNKSLVNHPDAENSCPLPLTSDLVRKSPRKRTSTANNPFRLSPSKKRSKFKKASPAKKKNSSHIASIYLPVGTDECSQNAFLYSLEDHDSRGYLPVRKSPRKSASGQGNAATDFSSLLAHHQKNDDNADNDDNVVVEKSPVKSLSASRRYSSFSLGSTSFRFLQDDLSMSSISLPSANQSSAPPIDLRLVTKIKLTSGDRFSFFKSPNDESQPEAGLFQLSTNELVKCSQYSTLSSVFDPRLSQPNQLDPSQLRTEIAAACIYYSCPNLPWLSNFPRKSSLDGVGNVGSSSGPGRRYGMRTSASSASLVRSGEKDESNIPSINAFGPAVWDAQPVTLRQSSSCSNFPDSFQDSTNANSQSGTNPASSAELKVLITPTTRGLRQALRDEGIEFSCPLRDESRRTSKIGAAGEAEADVTGDDKANCRDNSGVQSSSECSITSQDPCATQSQPPLSVQQPNDVIDHLSSIGKENEEEDEMNMSEEDPSKWMEEDLEISPTAIQKFRLAVSENRLSTGSGGSSSSLKGLNEDPLKSVVLIHRRINVQALFNFLNTTKLARGYSHKTSVSSDRKGHLEYVLEISGGPILPSCVYNLSTLLQNSQNHNFKVECNTGGNQMIYEGFNAVNDKFDSGILVRNIVENSNNNSSGSSEETNFMQSCGKKMFYNFSQFSYLSASNAYEW